MLDLKAICEALGWQGGTIHQAIAGIKAICAERDKLTHEHHLVRADAQARVDAAVIRALAAERERDELALGHRSQHDADSIELRRVCAERDAARKERDDLRARLAELEYARPVPAIPAGWTLVPVEPTPEMIATATAGDEAYSLRSFGPGVFVCQGGEDHWAAMISAAPEAAR